MGDSSVARLLSTIAAAPEAHESGLLNFAQVLLDGASDEGEARKRIDGANTQALKRFKQQYGAKQVGSAPHWSLYAFHLYDIINPKDASVPRLSLNPDEYLTGPMAALYESAGVPNRARSLSRMDSKSMQVFMKQLVVEMASKNPVFKDFTKLQFKTYPGNLSGVLLRGFPRDLYKVFKAFETLDADSKVEMARTIVNFATGYFNLDQEYFRNDVPTPQLTEFKFEDFGFDQFVNGALKKGYLSPDTTFQEIQEGQASGDYVFSPQGRELLTLLTQFFRSDAKIGPSFDLLKDIQIRQTGAPEKPLVLMGDGLSGEQAAHYLASDNPEVRYAHVIAPDITRDASMVTAAFRYLSYLMNSSDKAYQREAGLLDIKLRSGEGIAIRAGSHKVGGADIAEHVAFARALAVAQDSVDPLLQSLALYTGFAYAARYENPMVLGGHLVAGALGNRVDGIVRLQSPTTMHAGKIDLVPLQSLSYAFSQWLKDLITLIEVDDGRHVAQPVSRIAKTDSVRQNRDLARILGHVHAHPIYGVQIAEPAEASGMIHEPVQALLDILRAESPGGSAYTPDRSGGLRTNSLRTMSIMFFAEIAMKLGAIPKLLTAKDKRSKKHLNGISHALPDELGLTYFQDVRKLKKLLAGQKTNFAAAMKSSTMLDKMGADGRLAANAIASKQFFGLGRVALARQIKQAGGFPLFVLEQLRKNNPDKSDFYVKTALGGHVEELGLRERSTGARVGFRSTPDDVTKIEMFISPASRRRGSEIVMPYDFVDTKESGPHLKSLGSDQVPQSSLRKFPLQSGSRNYLTRAEYTLGLRTDNTVTAISQSLVGQVLEVLADPALGFDIQNLTIDSLTFINSMKLYETDLSHAFHIDKIFGGVKQDASGKQIKGQFVEGRVVTTKEDFIANEVIARLFIKDNKDEGTLTTIEQPTPLTVGANTRFGNFSVMSAALWKRFVELGGDPNLIHTVNLAGTAAGAKGAFAPGFGLAAQIETQILRMFPGARLEKLITSFFGKLAPGGNYDFIIQPSTDPKSILEHTDVHLDFHVLKPGTKSKPAQVLVAGRAHMNLITENVGLTTGAQTLAGNPFIHNLPPMLGGLNAGFMAPAFVAPAGLSPLRTMGH